MTDLIILGLVGACALVSLRHPWIGVLGWTWISLMNPHRLGWRTQEMPVALIIAACLLLGFLLTKDRRNPLPGPSAWMLLLFMVWMCITFPFSFFPDAAYSMWDRVMKIDFMVLVALSLIYKRSQIIALTGVAVASLAFYGVKGGIFTILTGGNHRVWGPMESFIEGNNELALALIVTIPLMRFLQTQLKRPWERHAMTGAMLLCAASAIGSHSRGAFVAIAAMGAMMWWRGKHKFMFGLLLVVGAAAVMMLMPEHYWERMNTIKTYEEDGSALGRINAWWMAFNLANDNFFGGGYAIYNVSVFMRYAPDPLDVKAAHSIYFQVLGEHGWIGFTLFMLMWLFTWRDAGWLRKHAAGRPETEWAATLGAMSQVALVGYAVGGAFLSLAYFDLPYNILILTAAARRWMVKRGWEAEAEEAEARNAEKAKKKSGMVTT
ncbi:putative O-glycosylation ligase, exosortase A system-associated [Uliginosibacterium sp. H1]|uniref:putative O-glycosylation ligase, exosortase A system-associated n=1 Tax=Uliginosibacterium sp. H1 TaxID=3114757 RepID=UPI002E17E2DA|nr:putative O-glycosylation ligase, exosortase A system-associated [Uliginosibacterium sp. H1]